MPNQPESKYSEDVRQHLSFIQGVITRMNSNSFSMKGWMVAIVSALLAVYATNATNCYSYVYFIAAIVADIIFCFLDAFYLKMEKQYRDLYDTVRKKLSDTDFDMDATGSDKTMCDALKSTSVWVLYFAVFVLLVVGLVLFFVLR